MSSGVRFSPEAVARAYPRGHGVPDRTFDRLMLRLCRPGPASGAERHTLWQDVGTALQASTWSRAALARAPLAARACLASMSDWFPASAGTIAHVDGGVAFGA